MTTHVYATGFVNEGDDGLYGISAIHGTTPVMLMVQLVPILAHTLMLVCMLMSRMETTTAVMRVALQMTVMTLTIVR